MKPASRIIALASGKGGVGKTVCTANLSYHLAKRYKVLTLDLDIGCGNLNASLGVRETGHTINDFFAGRIHDLGALKTRTSVDRLQFISCSYNPVENTVLTAEQKDTLLRHLRSETADYVLMDLGAGVNDDVLDFFAAADIRILVTAPESLALHNAFMFVKSLVFRVVVRSLHQCGLAKKVKESIIRQLYESGQQEIGRTIDRIRSRHPVAGDFIQAVLSGLQVHIILNRAQSPSEEQFVTNLQQLTRKSVHLELNYLGAIPFDDNVKKSLNEVVPFALEYSWSPASKAFETVTAKLGHYLKELGFIHSSSENGGRPTRMRRLGLMIEGQLSKTAGHLRSKKRIESDLLKEYELTIRHSEREASNAKALHAKEKREWRKEIDRLSSEIESLRERHARSEKKLEESLIRRDEFIEKLQHELRDKERMIRALKDQLKIHR